MEEAITYFWFIDKILKLTYIPNEKSKEIFTFICD